MGLYRVSFRVGQIDHVPLEIEARNAIDALTKASKYLKDRYHGHAAIIGAYEIIYEGEEQCLTD